MSFNDNGVVVVPPWAEVQGHHEVCGRQGCQRLVGLRPRKCALCNVKGDLQFGIPSLVAVTGASLAGGLRVSLHLSWSLCSTCL
jgi:hypothetical protein